MKKFTSQSDLDEITLEFILLELKGAKEALEKKDKRAFINALNEIKGMDVTLSIDLDKASNQEITTWINETLSQLNDTAKEDSLNIDEDWDMVAEDDAPEKIEDSIDFGLDDLVNISKKEYTPNEEFEYGKIEKGKQFDINRHGFDKNIMFYCLGILNTPGPLQLKTLDHIPNPLPAKQHDPIAHIFKNPTTSGHVVLCQSHRMPQEKIYLKEVISRIKNNLDHLSPPVRVIVPMGEDYTQTGHHTLLAIDIHSKTKCTATIFDSLTKSYLRSAKSYMMGHTHKNSSHDIRELLEEAFSEFPKNTVVRHYYSHQNALTEHNCGAHTLNIAHFCMDHMNMSLDEIKQCLPTANGYWNADNFLTQEKYHAILEFAAGVPSAIDWCFLEDKIKTGVKQTLSQVKSQQIKHSALYQAGASGNMTALKKALNDENLKKADSDKLYKDKDGHSSVLIIAAVNNHFNVVSEIIRQHDQHHVCPGLRSIKTKHQGTALNILVEKACFMDHTSARSHCLQAIKDYMTSITENYSVSTRFEDYCSQQNASGQTPLHIIAATNQTDLLDCLAQFKCQGWSGTYETRHIFDFTKKNAQGQTPLELAAERGHVDVLKAMYALNPGACPKREYTHLLDKAQSKAKINDNKGLKTGLLFNHSRHDIPKKPLDPSVKPTKKPKMNT